MSENQEPLCALDICNMALKKLGKEPIQGIDPNGSPAARLCYMHYHPVRREVLCAHAWKFATKKVTLRSQDGRRVRLPGDTLRVIHCNVLNWTLRGRTIYAEAKTADLLYTADEEDCELFDPLFVEAFATRLACKLCIPLTASTTKQQVLATEWCGMDFSAKGGWA